VTSLSQCKSEVFDNGFVTHFQKTIAKFTHRTFYLKIYDANDPESKKATYRTSCLLLLKFCEIICAETNLMANNI